jgi:hypothetical protein
MKSDLSTWLGLLVLLVRPAILRLLIPHRIGASETCIRSHRFEATVRLNLAWRNVRPFLASPLYQPDSEEDECEDPYGEADTCPY